MKRDRVRFEGKEYRAIVEAGSDRLVGPKVRLATTCFRLSLVSSRLVVRCLGLRLLSSILILPGGSLRYTGFRLGSSHPI